MTTLDLEETAMTIVEHEKVEVRETVVELDPRVRRGAAFLDEWEDGWAQKIDLESFELRFGCNCVLGQVRGEYEDACEAYGQDAFGRWPRDHGFMASGEIERRHDDWDALERDWVTLIRQRQAEQA